MSDNKVNVTGQVKWFNSKAGYGFITVSTDSEEHAGKDIFVHHTDVMCSEEQYKYLMLGEYVSFVLEKSENENHEWKASDVRGVNGGKLMCETRRLNQTSGPRQSRPHPRGPREKARTMPSDVPGHNWVLMRSRNTRPSSAPVASSSDDV